MAARVLSNEEQAFADAMQRFGALLEELRDRAAQVKETGGDAQYAVLSTIESEEEKALARANWPMISMIFAL